MKSRYVLNSGLSATLHVSGATLRSRRVMWTWVGGHKNIILRMEAQEFGTQRQITKDAARQELETIERNERFVLFHRYRQFQYQSRKIRYLFQKP